MNINFKGDLSDLEAGISHLYNDLNFKLSEDGVIVKIEKITDDKLEIIKKEDHCTIRYQKKIHFFRALGLLLENYQEKNEFHIIEKPQFDTIGLMIDMSQGNAALKVESIKKVFCKMAIMGLNMCMLYTEDSYEINDEPYFGYMRSRYSYDELKACDDYAFMFGIEIIPCIQTLAHLTDVLKWDAYSDIKDDGHTLLVGHERTYEFIEKMIVAASKPFRTSRIHIGMDEAVDLGLGRYLTKNGYKHKFDIFNEHLHKVLKITKKMSLDPMIWSDMFFSIASAIGYYYDKESKIPEDVIDDLPKELKYVYWDYYNDDEGFYKEWIKRHREFGKDPIFAGGIWNWRGFGVNYAKTFKTTNAALNSCKEEGIKEVFATLWGDCRPENNIFQNLLGMQLFAEHGYSKELDEDKLKKRFEFCTRARYEDFLDINDMDEVPGVETGNPDACNPSKYLMWQDLLLGLFDKNIEGLSIAQHYYDLGQKMKQNKNRNGKYNFVFEFLEKACAVLTMKSELGIRIKNAYDIKDNNCLEYIVSNDLPELLIRIKDLRSCHRKQWHETYQPFGWEVMDIYYGGLVFRVDSTIERLKDYLSGRIDRVEELDRERLLFSKQKGVITCKPYNRMSTASRI